MSAQELRDLANDLANQAKAHGCRGVIVAVSRDEPPGIHSEFHIEHRGPCLELEGLTRRVVALVDKLWDGLVSRRA